MWWLIISIDSTPKGGEWGLLYDAKTIRRKGLLCSELSKEPEALEVVTCFCCPGYMTSGRSPPLTGHISSSDSGSHSQAAHSLGCGEGPPSKDCQTCTLYLRFYSTLPKPRKACDMLKVTELRREAGTRTLICMLSL